VGRVVLAQIEAGGTILGCVGASGIIRGVDGSTGSCRGGETALSWYTKTGADTAFLGASAGEALHTQLVAAQTDLATLQSQMATQSAALASLQAAMSDLQAELVSLTDRTPLGVAVSMIGSGSGKVTSSDAEIDCGADCTEVYPAGNTVTLTAAPQAGSTFTGWLGDCSGSAPCTLTLDGAKNVVAGFAIVIVPPPDDGGSGPCGGFEYVQHDNGLGGRWFDCNPLGTYSESTARAAAQSWNASAVISLATCGIFPQLTHVLVAQTPSEEAVWVYSGPPTSTLVGRVQLFTGADVGSCPGVASPIWR
jgi:hypothetical protein